MPTPAATTLYTIGHSNHPISRFLALLKNAGITTLIDVRTSPYSRYASQYNRDALEPALKEAQIRYIFAGKALGGRPSDPACYKQGDVPTGDADYLHEVDYRAVMTRDWFQTGATRLMEYAAAGSTAIMCSEEDPADCHRHHLVATYLLEHLPEIVIVHIRSDGNQVNARHIHAAVDDPSHEQLSLF